MTFGFPAYHTEHFEVDATVDLRRIVRDAIQSLSWNIGEETATVMTAGTSFGLRSCGEIVTVNFISPHSISVKSQCVLPTQCVDWGKNKANVHAFLDALKKRIS